MNVYLDSECTFCGGKGHRAPNCPWKRRGAIPVPTVMESNSDAAWDEWDRVTSPGDLDPLDAVSVRGDNKKASGYDALILPKQR